MPLRDHFRSPLDDVTSWDGFHGQWPAMIVLALSQRLPRRYVAAPQIHLGSGIEIDVGTFEKTDESNLPIVGLLNNGGGVATVVWAPPAPTLTIATETFDADEYEVRVYDVKRGRRLVAAIEIVSPANKDRPESRRAFVAKCASLLLNRVCVVIVDLVTTRSASFHADLLDFFGPPAQVTPEATPELYAVAYRWSGRENAGSLQVWAYPMAIGQSLPTLPLWLAEDFSVPLELEASYEETCRVLRIV